MTISTSVGRQFTVNELVTLAWQTAGLVEVSQSANVAQLAFGRRKLEVILDELPAENLSTRATREELVACVSGQLEYTLDAEILEVLNPAKYISASESSTSVPDSETAIEVVSRERWQAISARSATGYPTIAHVRKDLDALHLFVWPTPDEAGTLRLLVSRALADVADGNATVDLPAYWNGYLIHQLAQELAEGSSVDGEKVVRLGAKAAAALKKARAKAAQYLSGQIVLDHHIEVG